VLARAGLPAASVGSEVSIIRPTEPVDRPVMPTEGRPVEVLTFELSDLQSGDLTRNQTLQANDTVLVSAGPRVFISGEVRSPGGFPYARGLTARQAIALAGGLTEDGSWKGIRVVRRLGETTKELKLKPEDPVLPADIIEVRAKLF
jgi:polysaccharide export outer membrane protein